MSESEAAYKMMTTLRNKVIDKVLHSPIDEFWTPEDISGSSFIRELHKFVTETIHKHGDWLWLKDVLRGDEMWAKEGLELAERYAAALSKLDIGPRDVVHLIVGNHNHIFPCSFGLWMLGGVVSLGDINLEADNVAFQLEETKAKAIICVAETKDLVSVACKKLADPESVMKLSLDEVVGDFTNLRTMVEAIDEGTKFFGPAYLPKDTRSEVLTIFWSSGTTGRPKGIQHSHHSLHNIVVSSARKSTSFSITYVTSLSMFHFGGFFGGIYAMLLKGTLHHVYGPEFTLDKYLDSIVSRTPTYIVMGAHHFVQLSESELLANMDSEKLSSVKVIAPTGSAVPSASVEKMLTKFKNCKCVSHGIGQTELGGLTYSMTNHHLGLLMPQVKVKLVDPDTGKLCGPGEVGEICASSPCFMIGYLDKKQTEGFFMEPESEGQLRFAHTGDLAKYDEEGKLYYVDRLKEIIKYNNNHVSPTELEGILQRHPAIQESLVFGRPNPETQEQVTAVVVLKPGHEATNPAEIESFLNDQVADFKKIRGGVLVQQSLPRTTIGKLKRRELRNWAREEFKD